MKILITLFMLIFASQVWAGRQIYEVKAIIRAVDCKDSFLNGRYCITAAKYITGPYRGQTCTNNRLVGAVGDTIQVTIQLYNSLGGDENYCQMR